MKILFYNLDKMKYELLKPYIKWDISLIDDRYQNENLSDLFETNYQIYGEGQTVAIYSGFNQDEIVEFIKSTKGFVPMINATITEHNASWTIKKLVSDLLVEHEIFKCYEDLHRLLNKLNSKLATLDDEQKGLVLKAYMQYQNKEENIELLKESIKQLEIISGEEKSEI